MIEIAFDIILLTNIFSKQVDISGNYFTLNNDIMYIYFYFLYDLFALVYMYV